ncbi:MAG TPA: hypothetical protein VIL30_08145, partial [Ramlibacter sp.]
MHTAICAFPDRAAAERAVEQLVAAGVDRQDVHLEHRSVDGDLTMPGEGAAPRDKPAPNDTWDGLEREVAVDRNILENFGRFFASLLGRDDHSGHIDTYSKHVERGSVVVAVDARDEAEARRASQLLHGLQASDTHVLHRAEQRPLRDIVGERQAGGMERAFGTARSEMPQGTRGRQDSVEEDRAMAAARAGDRPGLEEEGDRPGLKLKNMGRSDGI